MIKKEDFFPDFANRDMNMKPLKSIPREIEELLRYLHIPEDEWLFTTGLETDKVPANFLAMTDKFRQKGVKIEKIHDPDTEKGIFFKKAGVFSLMKTEDKAEKIHRTKSYGGLYIRVPEHLMVQDDSFYLPSLLKFSFTPYQHTYLEFGEGSSASISLGTPVPKLINSSFYLSGVEIIVRNGAEANVTLLHSFPWYLDARTLIRFVVEKDAKLRLSLLNFNSGVVTCRDIKGEVEDGASFILNTVSIGTQAERYFEWVDIAEKGRSADVSVNMRHASFDSASSNHVAIVKAEKGAINARASLNSVGLLLSQKAEQHTLPALITQEEQVEMSHSASIGHIEENMLNYLQSRGLDTHDVVELRIKSYLEDVVKHSIPPEFYRQLTLFIEYVVRDREFDLII